jgi:energy-coupling factor transporter ATP-binding protein EcfA2
MAIAFRHAVCPPLSDVDAIAPDGAVIGIVGENGSGKTRLLRLAAGVDLPVSGVVECSGAARFLGPLDALNLAPTPVLLMDGTLAQHDWLVRERTAVALERMRQSGSTVLLVSHEEDLLRLLADEIWWLREGRLAGRGDPDEMLTAYRRSIAARFRAWGGARNAPLSPRMRRGDGRAEVAGVQTLGEGGELTAVWRSGELAVVKTTVRFREAVADPVVGMMIRSRIGLNVYGTNTELEHVKLGPCAPGATLRVSFAFRCELCPGDYTLTLASHDPDGVWHDWLEDAVAFTVTDGRYTAGVANLRATVTMEKVDLETVDPETARLSGRR